MTPLRTLRIISRSILLLVCATILGLGILFSSGREFGSAYERLEPGMMLTEIERTLDRSPVHICTFGDWTTAYFCAPRPSACFAPSHVPDTGYPDRVESAADTPFLYDCVQVLADANGVARAITWNGEELDIHTEAGPYPGSHIAKLPAGFFAPE